MFNRRIYFDNASSTPINRGILKAIKPYLNKRYGNPSSVHKEGREVRFAIERARHQVAVAIGCSDDEIFFTSGASESNSIIAKSSPYMFTLGNNHDSLELGANKFNWGVDEVWLGITYINNETGEEFQFKDEYLKKFSWIHADLTQLIGKKQFNLSKNKWIISASFSAHKFGGLKGTGVLFVRKEFQPRIKPLIYGHQEEGFRGGTENVVGIVALGEAITMASKNALASSVKINNLTDYIYMSFLNKCEKITSNNGIINITFKHLDASSAVQILDSLGVAISAGSACNSGSDEPSKVLLLSGYSKEEALKTIRISIGFQNSKKEVRKFCKILNNVIDKYDLL